VRSVEVVTIDETISDEPSIEVSKDYKMLVLSLALWGRPILPAATLPGSNDTFSRPEMISLRSMTLFEFALFWFKV